MGLLKKKQARPPSILASKNPTGLPTRDNNTTNVQDSSSLIAAQAAALLFKSTKPSTQASHQPPKPPTQRRNSSKHASPILKQTTQKRDSVVLPYSSTQLAQLSLSDSDDKKSQIPSHPYSQSQSNLTTNTLPIPVYTNRGRTTDKRNSSTNLTSIQAASIAAARSVSSDFLAPPLPLSLSRNNSTGRSDSGGSIISSNPSAHSFESLPLYAKLQNLDVGDNGLRKFSSFSSGDGPEASYEYDNTGEESYRYENEADNLFDDYVFDDKTYEGDSARQSDYGYDSDNLFIDEKQLSPVHEVKSPILENTETLEQPKPTLTHEISTPKSIPLRKPPPISPPYSPDTSCLSSPSQDFNYRSVSPRRKPPGMSRRTSEISTRPTKPPSNTSHESLPQYPFPTEIQKGKDHHHHHQHKSSSHGFRKSAKKILKKGFKVSSGDSKVRSSNSDTESALSSSVQPRPVQLKTTMRKEKKSKFNEDKPWKHHYDREYITEQERKRYEGVWVSNKGLYMDKVDPLFLKPDIESSTESMNPALQASKLSTKTDLQTLESNLMLNLVVKELWLRSRLPKTLLEQIWDLVDTRKDGTLDKRGFIVGMWYVDQCLYGRKLPKVVDEAVWNSVSHMGVNVVIKRSKRKK